MRLLKALTIAALTAGVLAAAATATVDRPPLEDGTLSIRDGRATIQLRMKGSLIGRLTKGQIVVTDSPDAGATIIVRGAESERSLSDRTTVYSGRNIRFRIADERTFVVRMNASKINLSAVGRGQGWLDGWGNRAAGVYFDGSFSLNGSPYKSIPDERDPIQLSALPSGG